MVRHRDGVTEAGAGGWASPAHGVPSRRGRGQWSGTVSRERLGHRLWPGSADAPKAQGVTRLPGQPYRSPDWGQRELGSPCASGGPDKPWESPSLGPLVPIGAGGGVHEARPASGSTGRGPKGCACPSLDSHPHHSLHRTQPIPPNTQPSSPVSCCQFLPGQRSPGFQKLQQRCQGLQSS